MGGRGAGLVLSLSHRMGEGRGEGLRTLDFGLWTLDFGLETVGRIKIKRKIKIKIKEA